MNAKKLLLFIVIIFSVSKSYSCSCTAKPSVKMNWESANEIFNGKIVSVDSLLYGNNGAKIYSYTVKILKSFKIGFYKNREFRTILTQDGSSCDFMFEIGKEYLIYAKEDNQTLSSSICSRTSLFKNVEKEESETLEKLYESYVSDVSRVRFEKFQNNVSYQIDLVKNGFEQKIHSQNSIIYALSGIIILLFIIILIKTIKS
ncbi:hypothetical protein [Flavobacterium sp.]|uniref:hypothetical protein n=1 Tax=Flavobacterium sp. TaxID=239 RepID=UPI00286C8306|nr:hypothetical protein [Flavobacterium sp.]